MSELQEEVERLKGIIARNREAFAKMKATAQRERERRIAAEAKVQVLEREAQRSRAPRDPLADFFRAVR